MFISSSRPPEIARRAFRLSLLPFTVVVINNRSQSLLFESQPSPDSVGKVRTDRS